jgi:hypothetical protein
MRLVRDVSLTLKVTLNCDSFRYSLGGFTFYATLIYTLGFIRDYLSTVLPNWAGTVRRQDIMCREAVNIISLDRRMSGKLMGICR